MLIGVSFSRTWQRLHSDNKRLTAAIIFYFGVIVGTVACISRVQDWVDDRSLFRAAVTTCPSSAKMNIMYGQQILSHDSAADSARAREHFEIARAIDPQYCDVDFVMGKSFINQNDADGAVHSLQKSLSCKFTAQRAYDLLLDIERVLNAQVHDESTEEGRSWLEDDHIDDDDASNYWNEERVKVNDIAQRVRACEYAYAQGVNAATNGDLVLSAELMLKATRCSTTATMASLYYRSIADVLAQQGLNGEGYF